MTAREREPEGELEPPRRRGAEPVGEVADEEPRLGRGEDIATTGGRSRRGEGAVTAAGGGTCGASATIAVERRRFPGGYSTSATRVVPMRPPGMTLPPGGTGVRSGGRARSR